MKIDLQKFRAQAKYINEIPHKEADLIMWNYSHACQYDNAWTEESMMARGLITDKEGNIVARPFKKFFNLGQTDETKFENIVQLGKPEIYDKLDGSLGILYYRDGVPCISTRGSFNSEQAEWATTWLHSQGLLFRSDTKFLDGYTYLFEIIYPGNRIVVDYGDRRELVLLAVVHIDTGEELDYVAEAQRLGLQHATRFGFDFKEIMDRAKALGGNEEGFVLKYPNGLRVKIKGEEYVRLHRLITGFSNKSVWELLKNNQSFDEFLERVPDEFYEWVKKTKSDLQSQFLKIYEDAIRVCVKVKDIPSRKEQAEIIMKEHGKISGIIFCFLDGKGPQAREGIWKQLKPTFSKPFKIDIDA